MRDSVKEWCTPELISIDYIDELAMDRMENFQDSTTVYLSHDVYARLHKEFIRWQRYASGNDMNQPMTISSIVTSTGQLNVKRIPHLSNFCYVGTEASFQRLEWAQIDEQFEKIFFGES